MNIKLLLNKMGEKINFVGPQPVSMSLNEIDTDNPHNILSGYVVTEKADGINTIIY